MATRYCKKDFTLGALYRLALKRQMPRPTIEALLTERVGLNATKAHQIAGHWLSSGPFRDARKASSLLHEATEAAA